MHTERSLLLISFATMLACSPSPAPIEEALETPADMASDAGQMRADMGPGDMARDRGEVGDQGVEEMDVGGWPPVPELPEESAGKLGVLTYNVAGLPDNLSSSNPELFIPQISPLLNAYELVLAQEDFCYHAELLVDVDHAYQSPPEFDPGCRIVLGPRNDIGDGLNRLSRDYFHEFDRQDWGMCNGMSQCSSDCLTKKGFTFARHHLARDVTVDVYNLHMEAGGCEKDLEARTFQVNQLLDYIAEKSKDRAIIVAGDFNMRRTDPEDVPLLDQIRDTGILDACDELACGDQRIDHVMFRSAPQGMGPQLSVTHWEVPTEFVDAENNDLSDHLAVFAEFDWKL